MLSVKLRKSLSGFNLDVNFTVSIPSYSLILGPSGAGKSLTLKIIAGLMRPDMASIQWRDKEIAFLPPEKREVVYLPQTLALFPHKTVYQNIIYTFKARHISVDERYVTEIIDKFEVTPFLNRYPSSLSGGEQQRVALARAIAARPKVLLLDEPLASLDFHLKMNLIDFLKRIKKAFSLTIIHVTHDPIEAFKLAENLFILEKGKLTFQGTVKELFMTASSGFSAEVVRQLKSVFIFCPTHLKALQN